MEHSKVQLGYYNDSLAGEVPFSISYDDRHRHMHVVGQTGTGKSTLIKRLALADIHNGEGVCFIDPHGTEAEDLINQIPPDRIRDVVYFNAADRERPCGLQLLQRVSQEERDRLTSEIVGTFKHRWADTWGQRMEYIFKNTIRALLDHPTTRHGSTLLAVQRMYVDEAFRRNVIKHITNPSVRSFWEQEFATYTARDKSDRLSPIQNKTGMFTMSDTLRTIIGQAQSTIDIDYIINNRKILIVNLATGEIGEDNADLLGSFLVTMIALAHMHRSKIPERDRVRFNLIVDEFQRFTSDAFISIFSEARKFKLTLTVAHQYIKQMTPDISAAVFGNCGTFISFRVGADDAPILSRHLDTSEEVLTDLSNHHVAAKVNVDGHPIRYHGRTLPIDTSANYQSRTKVIRHSRQRYGCDRRAVEKDLSRWQRRRYAMIRPKPKKRTRRRATVVFVQP